MAVDHPRRIRSFVRRPGRITTGQQRALRDLMPRWGVEFSGEKLDLGGLFGRAAPRVLDIGFGDGEALVTTAARYPEIDYLGIEVHEPGIGHLLKLIERAALTNIRIVRRDAIDVIDQMLPDASFDAVNLFFPDPWPKKRHHKRRLVQSAFLASAARVLRTDGLLHIATDWSDYGEQIGRLIGDASGLRPVAAAAIPDVRLAFRPPTKFERRGLGLGHEVAEFWCLKTAGV